MDLLASQISRAALLYIISTIYTNFSCYRATSLYAAVHLGLFLPPPSYPTLIAKTPATFIPWHETPRRGQNNFGKTKTAPQIFRNCFDQKRRPTTKTRKGKRDQRIVLDFVATRVEEAKQENKLFTRVQPSCLKVEVTI